MDIDLIDKTGEIAAVQHPRVGGLSPHPFNPGHRFYVPQVTLTKVFLSQDTKSSQRRAGDLLAQLMNILHPSQKSCMSD